MLFKFKSQAASDLIMLEADARSLLKIMLGDDPVKGIVQVQDLASAVAALTAAVLQDTLARQQQVDQAKNRVNDPDEDRLPMATVSLSQRAAPMLKMLQRCQAQGSDMVWGV
jgi:hypothetical protein